MKSFETVCWSAVIAVAAGCSVFETKQSASTAPAKSNQVSTALNPTASSGGSTSKLEAKLESRSETQATGWLRIEETPQGMLVEAEVENVSPGPHGFHVHEKGDCSAPDASSAGGHFNPSKNRHGRPGSESHVGDFGNVIVGPDKKGKLTLRLPHLKASDLSAFAGKSVVLHEKEDDLRTQQPPGNAGGRIACGVLR